MEQKLLEYFQSGTRLAWLINPGPRSVAVYNDPERAAHVPDEHAQLYGADVLPGFAVAVADLFRNVPRFD